MKIKIVDTGKCVAGATKLVQDVIDGIAASGGKVVSMSDSGMRIALIYLEGNRGEKTNEKQTNTDNNGRTRKTEVPMQPKRSPKPKGSKKPSKG